MTNIKVLYPNTLSGLSNFDLFALNTYVESEFLLD